MTSNLCGMVPNPSRESSCEKCFYRCIPFDRSGQRRCNFSNQCPAWWVMQTCKTNFISSCHEQNRFDGQWQMLCPKAWLLLCPFLSFLLGHFENSHQCERNRLFLYFQMQLYLLFREWLLSVPTRVSHWLSPSPSLYIGHSDFVEVLPMSVCIFKAVLIVW